MHRLAHGQPLVVQRICQELISHLNHELFDLEIEREARILPSDLDAVLTDSFIRSESRYFNVIWTDQIEAFPDQRTLLFALAAADIVPQKSFVPSLVWGMWDKTFLGKYTTQSPAELTAATGFSAERVVDALNALQRRDVIDAQEGRWLLLMPLFRRWLRLHRDSA